MNEGSYLSLSQVARLANAPESRVRKAKRAGKLEPDFIVGRTKVFKVERLDVLLQTLSSEGV